MWMMSSGLSNGNCLKALTELGYGVAVGDSTWPHLRNDAKPYQMLRTTIDSSNWSGFKIIARWATGECLPAKCNCGASLSGASRCMGDDPHVDMIGSCGSASSFGPPAAHPDASCYLSACLHNAEIYYNAATRAGNTAEYNKMYANIFNGNATWDDLVGREAERVVHSALLALRHDVGV
jgi:hypothetical protein